MAGGGGVSSRMKNNVLFLDSMAEGCAECWEGLAPQPGVSAQAGFPFHTAFVPRAWLSPLGRTSVGTGSCFPAIAGPAFLNVI